MAKDPETGLTPKELSFCQQLDINKGNGSKAYHASDYASCNNNVAKSNAYILLQKPRIKAYLAAQRAVTAEKVGYSIEQALKEYEDDRQQAKRLNQPAAAISAVTGKARLFGFDKDADTNSSQQQEIDENRRIEAERLAKTRLIG